MPNVPIVREVSFKIDWFEFSKNLIDAAAQGVLTYLGGDGVSGGISALIGAIGSLKADADPGQKIWSITLLCFAWTLDELKADGKTDVEGLRTALRIALEQARERVDDGLEVCPVSFFDRPVTLPLYRYLRDTVIKEKHLFRADVQETPIALQARFDSAFNRSMFEILSRKPDLYQLVASVFSVGGVRVSELELNWQTYKQRLIYDFEVKSVFGQESSRISLSQLYVPLRGYWSKTEEKGEDDPFGQPLSETHNIQQLDELLDNWVNETHEDESIRLIGGGPGSGKSTTLKAFARRMADRVDYRTLFIPLQHLDLQGNLRDAINTYFTDQSSSAFTQSPLARPAVEDGPPLLLIFDGLDELARPGEAANEVVNLFATKLNQLIVALRGDINKPIKAVVSGRMPSFQAARKYLSAPASSCIEVYGYNPLERSRQNSGYSSLWLVDQRPIWWDKYSSLTNMDRSLPPAFSSEQLAGVTHEPLLCYLLVLSGFATKNWEQAAENPNIIYKELINSVWERGWGEGRVKRQGPGKTLTKTDFNDLMQAIALAAWLGGDTRIATENNFHQAIKLMAVEGAWKNFTSDNGADVTNLAMNFYLKAAESKQRGFEFTHKSFGDYLAARAVLAFAEDLCPWIERHLERGMGDWLDATGTGTLTNEILVFLRNEVKLQLAENNQEKNENYIKDIVARKSAFEKLVSAALVDGFSSYKADSTWRMAENKQSNAEIMAWAVLNSFAWGLASLGREEHRVAVKWSSSNDAIHRLLKRCTRMQQFGNPFLRCFSFIIAPGSNFFGLVLSGIDLRGADLSDARFAGCHLTSANFSSAKLSRANFERAMLDNADLSNAVLDHANLIDARLDGVDLKGASLKKVQISLMTLLHIDLKNSPDIVGRLNIEESYYSRGGRLDIRDIKRNIEYFEKNIIKHRKHRALGKQD